MGFASILIVENNQQFLRELRANLIASSYCVVEAAAIDDALLKLRDDRPDMILLGVTPPGVAAVDLCKEIRLESNIPIIILTTQNMEHDRVAALDAGADDCIVKTVGVQELLARIRAALRRASLERGRTEFECGDLHIDFERRVVLVRGERTHLTPKEFQLLSLFVANLGKPIPHRRILQVVWGPDYGDESECLRVQIYQLRKKIERDPRKPTYICTEPALGYRFEAGPEARSVRGRSERKRVRSAQEKRQGARASVLVGR